MPESQLDRFMICLSIGYPSLENQMRIINAQRYSNPLSDVRPVTNAHETSEDRYGLPEKNENKAAYLLRRSLRAALLTAGALIALMVIWNVGLKGLFILPLGGAVTVLLGCIAGDYLGAKKPLPSAFVILREFRRIDCENRWFCKKSRQIFDDVVYWC